MPEAVCSSTDFRCLIDQRARLGDQISEDQRKLDRANEELQKISEAKSAVAFYQAEGKQNPTAQSEAKQWSGLLSTYRPERQVRAEAGQLTGIVTNERQQLAKIESSIGSAIDIEKPKQVFKTELSIAFSILVGFVIGGFYWIVAKNPAVGRSIFVGDAGLQFITLFSLVIAIILFGLTEVLQEES